MVKVTVLYNLAPDRDADAFIRWRTGDHQQENADMPGVVATDFYVAADTALGPPAYRYITEVYFPNMATLEAHFLRPEVQAKIAEDVDRHGLTDFTLLISEKRAHTVQDTQAP